LNESKSNKNKRLLIVDETGMAARLSTPNFSKSYNLKSLLQDSDELQHGRFRHTLTKFKTKFNYDVLIKDIYGEEIKKYHRPNNPNQSLGSHNPLLKLSSEKNKFVQPLLNPNNSRSQFVFRDISTPKEDKPFYYITSNNDK
jgi:hypothetical protein